MRCLFVSVVMVVFLASSCFDAHQVDPGVLVIDDFEHGAFPVDSTFLPWQCFSFNPNGQRTYSCAYDTDTPIDGSMYSLRLGFEIADAMNGTREYGGVGLVTYSLFGLWQDFTPFATLGFGARVQSGIPALPSNTNVNVVLGCSTLADGTPAARRFVVQDWKYDGDGNWAEGEVSFVNFSPATGTKLDPADCLRRVDQVAIQVSPNLADGQSAAGILNIDNLYLK